MTGYVMSHLSKRGISMCTHRFLPHKQKSPCSSCRLSDLTLKLALLQGKDEKMARDPFQLPTSSDCRQTPMHLQAAHASMQNPQPRNADVQFSARAPRTARAKGGCRVLQYCKQCDIPTLQAGSSDTEQFFCHLCSLCRMPHLPGMNHGLDSFGCTCCHLVWAQDRLTFLCKISFSKNINFVCHKARKNITRKYEY